MSSSPMRIAVAGPYSAPTEAARAANLAAMNRAASAVLLRGHVPIIGMNAALGVVDAHDDGTSHAAPGIDAAAPSFPIGSRARYQAIMAISLAVVAPCDALLLLGSSPGADRERDLIAAAGKPIFTDVAQLPDRGPLTVDDVLASLPGGAR